MELNQVLSEMVAQKASDIYITVGAPVLLRVHGELQPLGEVLTETQTFSLLDSMMDEERRGEYRKNKSPTSRLSAMWVDLGSVLFSSVNYQER